MDIFSCHSNDDLRAAERSKVKNVPVRRSKQDVIYRSGEGVGVCVRVCVRGRVSDLLPLIKRNCDKLKL